MSIQKKEKYRSRLKKKQTYYYPVVFDPVRNKYIWGSEYLLKKDAKKAEADLLKQICEKKYIAHSEKMKFGKVAELWQGSRKSKPAATQKCEAAYISSYLKGFAEYDTARISSKLVQDWVNLMTEEGLAPKTVKKAYGIAKQILDYAVDPLRLIEQNPCSGGIITPKIKHRGITTEKYWTREEALAFFSDPDVKASPDYAMYYLEFTTGMRPGEVCGLSVNDLEDSLLSINYGISSDGKMTDLKRTKAQRTLHLPDETAAMLKEIKKESEKLQPIKFNGKGAEYRFLFCLENGAPFVPPTMRHHLDRDIQTVNETLASQNPPKKPIKRITPYGFRHTFATLSLISGLPVKLVAEIMGDTVESVLEHYAHVTPGLTKDALQSFTAILAPREEKKKQDEKESEVASEKAV